MSHPSADGDTQRTVLGPLSTDASDRPSTYTIPPDVTTATLKIPSQQAVHLILQFGAPSPTTTGLNEAFAALKRAHDLDLNRLRQTHEQNLQTEHANHERERAFVHEAKRQCVAQRDCLQADLSSMEAERAAMQTTMEGLAHRAETSDRLVASGVTMLQNVLATLKPPSPRSGDGDADEEFGQAQQTEQCGVDSDATEEDEGHRDATHDACGATQVQAD